jgi:hypothetical protein
MRRAPSTRAWRVALVGLAALATLAGCDRRTQLMPASSDSTHAAAPDSFALFARRAGERWEGGQNEQAADFSARVLHEAFRLRPNGPWVERARGVLDSLGIAAEVAGDDRAAVANLFSRADPDGESWPYLFWHTRSGPRFQAIDGRGLHLAEATARGFGEDSSPTDSAQVAVLWGRRAGTGPQPLLMVWKRAAGGRWDLLQSLGADSLGGTGTGEFTPGDSLRDLTLRTYRATPHFDECPTCPHVFHERRFAWDRAGFRRVDDRLVPSPYTTFTAFIDALIDDDRARAEPLVVDRSLVDFARRFEWNVAARGRWRVAPATDESAVEMVFFRGNSDAFRVRFEAREGDWLIVGFQPTDRSVE